MKKPTLDELTLREKIGQTCVALVKHAKGDPDYFIKHPYGAIWSAYWMLGNMELATPLMEYGYDISVAKDFAKNYDIWLKDVNKRLKVPILSAIDAETGCGANIPGCSRVPGYSSLGATNDPELAYKVGNRVATESLTAGCNWHWGPVADIGCAFCGMTMTRGYSKDKEVCKRMITAQLKGMQDAGVAATVKHFPGADIHEWRDSHIQPSEIGYSMEEWEQEQAPIFQAAIDAGVYSVMVGHSAFPAGDDTQIDGEYIPATLSYKIVTELLKEKMGFKGAVVTDGINMRGLTTFYTGGRLYVELLKAGNDMILGPFAEDYIDEVEKAVLSGELSEERINDACQRVLDMKEKLGLFRDDYTCGGGMTQEMRDETAELTREVSKKSMTLLVNRNNIIPLSKDNIKRVTIIYEGYSDVAYDNLKDLVKEFEKRGAEATFRRGIRSERMMKRIDKNSDLILYVAMVGGHAPHGMPTFYGKECKSFEWVLTEGKEKSIGVSLASPYLYYGYYLGIPAFINSFNAPWDVFVAGLYGDFEFNTTRTYPIKPTL